MTDTRAPEVQSLAPADPSPVAPSLPSTQPPRACIACNQPTKKCINFSFSLTGPEGEPRCGSGKFYVCGEHVELIKEMSMPDLEEMMARQEDTAQAQSGTG